MFRKIVVFGLALLMLSQTGCLMYQTRPDGSLGRTIAPQVGANVAVLDLCGGDPGILYPTYGSYVGGFMTFPGKPTWMALPALSGTTAQSVAMTYVQVVDGHQVGSVSQSFYVNFHQGSQRFQWVITKDRSWSGGGRNVYISQCPAGRR